MWKFNIHIDRGLNTVMENGRYAAVVQDPTIISRGLRGKPLPPSCLRCDDNDVYDATTTTRRRLNTHGHDRSWQTAKSDDANCEYQMSKLFAIRRILIHSCLDLRERISKYILNCNKKRRSDDSFVMKLS